MTGPFSKSRKKWLLAFRSLTRLQERPESNLSQHYNQVSGSRKSTHFSPFEDDAKNRTFYTAEGRQGEPQPPPPILDGRKIVRKTFRKLLLCVRSRLLINRTKFNNLIKMIFNIGSGSTLDLFFFRLFLLRANIKADLIKRRGNL